MKTDKIRVYFLDVFFTGAIIDSFAPIGKDVRCGFAYEIAENAYGRFYNRLFTITLPLEKVKTLKVGQKVMLDKSFL